MTPIAEPRRLEDSVGTTAPLSFAQQRLWLLEQLHPGSSAYHIPFGLRLRGPLDISALRAAFGEVVRRHSSLRTSFVTIEDEPRQLIRPADLFKLRVVDARFEADIDAAIRRFAADELNRPMDLERDVLMSATVVRVGEREHVLLAKTHHIASDGWSRQVLFKELSALYAAFTRNETPALAPVPLQYVHYAVDQHRRLKGQELERLRQYWHSQLDGVQATELPGDRHRPAVFTPAAGSVELPMDPDVVERLNALAKRERVTPFMPLLAAFQALLSRHCGKDDIAVGVPAANRNRLEVEPLIGFFINTLVLRTHVSGDPTFRALIGRVRQVALEAYEHQEYPFERLVADLKPPRDLSRNPLVQIVFNMADSRLEPFSLGDVQAVEERVFEERAKFDLTVYAWPHGSRPRLRFVYARDLFDHAHIAELSDQYVTFLRQALADPDKPIGRYSLVTDRARGLLPDPAAELDGPEPSESVVCQFMRHAARDGHREAVRWRDRSLTYHQLARAAEALAARLLERGVSRGDVVAFEGQRSVGLVVALLGVMAGRCVALPIDPKLPAARKRSMIGQSGARHLILVGLPPSEAWWDSSEPAVQTLRLDACPESCDTPNDVAESPAPLQAVSLDDPAYVFFTSGSSGEPKGILGMHASLSHYVEWQRATFGIVPHDRVGQMATWSFDIVLRDVFLPLTTGATLCIPDDDEAAWSPEALEWLARERVSVINIVPSVARRWLEGHTGHEEPLALRWVFFAGEPLPESLVRRWREVVQAGRQVNLYGPTETCMSRCWWQVSDPPYPGVQLIGRTMPASQALVLNLAGHPCGLHEPGEIVLRTKYGTKRYLAASATPDPSPFRPNPFAGQSRSPLYHTGDLGRYRHDGMLEILGRLDDQVKVNGTRIEPREIEAALERHPSVTSAAVVARKNADGDLYLAAFITGQDLMVESLRAHLATLVPPAMYPRSYAFLESLPLSASGKVDRAALRNLEVADAPLGGEYVPPRSGMEDKLTEIWRTVLDAERVGVHDNFFDLGGHSLLATRVMAGVQHAFGILLPLSAIFEAPTVAELAARLAATGRADLPPAAAAPVLTASGATRGERLGDYPQLTTAPEDEPARPSGTVEDTLAHIWAAVLGVPRVGTHDNFFDLGGHSLLAARVILRIQRTFGVQIPLRAIFEAPTISTLAVRLRELGALAAPTPVEPPDPAPAAGTDPPPAPLSFPQQRLWFLDALDPASSAYHISQALDLSGPLNEQALQSALTAVVRRHSALRTTFVRDGGELRQVIRPACEFPLRVVDLTSLPPDTRKAEVARHISETALAPFDLEQDLLIRAALLRLDEDRHVFVLTLNHIAADGWSFEVLGRDLRELYASALRGVPPDLPALPLQYADFARWQRNRLSGTRAEHLRDYWRRQLDGLPPLTLPTDRARPARLTYRGALSSFEVPAAVADSLRQLGRSENATLFMTVLAAFQALLGRHGGQHDFAVGTPLANRPLPEHESLIGFFANTLVIRADLSGDPTFRRLVARARQTALAAYEHGELPFEQLVADTSPVRELNQNPLVQVVFSLQDKREPLRLAGLDVSERQVEVQRSRFDLELHLRAMPDGSLRGSFIYATDLFNAETVTLLASHFVVALESVAAEPDIPLSRVPMVPASERRRLLEEWTDTAVDYPRDAGLATLFDVNVARAPGAVAVVDGERQVTYAELDSRASRIAGRLRALGVGPGARVALCVERSVELVAATLGIIKAGAAYVPLDPADPPARMALMIAGAGVPVVLTVSSLRGRVPPADCTVLTVDEPLPECPDYPLPAVSGDAVACVMFTSGSTGEPKGVMVPHRAITRLVVRTNYVRLAHGDAVALAANPAFDASTFEIWGALLNGARLVVVRRDVLLAPSLPAFLREQGVTTMFLTTSLFNHIAHEMPGALASVRDLIFGGEAADAASVRRVLEAGKPARLINGYGPTEATTFAACHEIGSCDPTDRTVPIGRPIANTTIYILDEADELAPIGAPGELCIGGDGLALGYLNEPALTAARFVPHPFVPGRRLYRTGDRARWRSDGLLEYLGRRDGLLKLRGYRVEVGEVESALASHASIAQCVVAAAGDGTDKRLIAYAVPRHGWSIDPAALTEHLRACLPLHMVPATFVTLDDLPLTRNGKVDRRALPPPELAIRATPVRSPQGWTTTEIKLARIWREVLGITDIEPEDNFFSLGGHSLLAVRLFAFIEQEFGVELPLSQLFEHGSIRSLALVLDVSRHSKPWTPLVPIRPTGSEKPLFLVHGVGGEVLSFKHLASRLPDKLPVFGIQAAGPGSQHPTPVEIPDLAERYADAVASADSEGPYYIGGFSYGAVTALEIAHVLRRRGKRVALLLLIDGGLPAGARARRRVRHTAASMLRQMAYWVIDDALATPARDWWPRVGGKCRSLASRLRARLKREANGYSANDLRHHLGMWRFPEKYRDLLRQRFDAFQRHVPTPYEGDIALVRSRTGRLFGRRPENLDDAWRALARGSFSVTYVRGSHASMLEPPLVDELAQAIAACIDRARASTVHA